jgi:hypothetical protein
VKSVGKDEIEVIEHVENVAISVLLQLFLDAVDASGLCDDGIVVSILGRVGQL